MSGLSRSAVALLGSQAVTRVVATSLKRNLRILAYHEIGSPGSFESQLEYLARHFNIVSGTDVASWYRGEGVLPERAVWLTFDDGDPSVFAWGRGVLARYGFPATMFICPGHIDTDEPFWWEAVINAGRQGVGATVDGQMLRGGALVARLKTVPDHERRRVVHELVEEAGGPQSRRQLRTNELREWLAAGHELGNHTWDHPCLDRCSPEEQRRQIVSAHDWLEGTIGEPVKAFAYPNGNWAHVTEHLLAELGYEIALGFDHRLATRGSPALRLSRLRVNADAAVPRLRSIVSGAHSALAYVPLRFRNSEAPRRLPRG